MVIKGNEITAGALGVANFEGDRIRLPSRFVKSAKLMGRGPIDCWLLVVTPGRYRLLKQSAEDPSGALARIRDQIEEIVAPGDLLEGTEDNGHAAIPSRLIPCVATPRGPGWRVNVPKEAKGLASDGDKARFVFLLVVAGFVEIWFPDTLRQAVSVPISELLP